MKKTYASLHNHSDYSNIRGLDSIITIEALIDTAVSQGFSAIALTDHDVLSGHVKAIQHYKENYIDSGTKLILGNEIYLTREGLSQENYVRGENFFHFLLLAKDEIGHRQLRELSSRAWERSFIHGVPRTPTYISDLKEIVGSNPGHLIATTACIGGIPGVLYQTLGKGATEEITQYLNTLEDIFGKDNFYLEVQPSALEGTIEFNQYLIETFWSKYPFVFTTDSHYVEEGDAEIHKYFLKSHSIDRDVDSFYSNNYLMEYEQIQKEFYYISPDKVEVMRQNTLKIADMVESYDLYQPQIVPSVEIEMTPQHELFIEEARQYAVEHEYKYIANYANSEQLVDRYYLALIIEGFHQLVSEEFNKEYFDRINYELEQVWETSIKIEQPVSSYFVTMAKMIDIIWNEADSLVGVSRGSAAGFLTNYLMGITQIDPLRQVLELPAWRFIHKDRPGLPDIDIDTEGDKRTRVFNQVKEYFESIGGTLISVATFGTEKSKSALRTAGRGLQIDDDNISYIVSMIPNERGNDWTLQQCMYGDETHKPIPKFQAEMRKNPKLWELASKIEGLITRIGVHAAGVIALNDVVTAHNSVMKTSSGALVTAFNLEDTEYMGGLKYDFLTINALDKIRTTMNLLLDDGVIEWKGTLRDTYNHYLLPKNLDYDTPEMWEWVSQGKIVDLFQFDTQVGTQAVRTIKPKNIAELSVANSVMRLMTEDEEMPLETYSRFKHDLRAWYREMHNAGLTSEEVKLLEKYLLPLSGVADSQESAMLLVMDPNIAAFSVTEANDLRKAIARKNPVVLAETKAKFYHHGEEVGASKRLLDYVWNRQIMRQAGYSFSVLHTMGYSTIALQEMNLAYHYPIIYWNTACLSVNAGAVNEEDYHNLVEQGIIQIDGDEMRRSSNKVQYGKVAATINKFRSTLGLQIGLPHINYARFGFTPEAKNNRVLFGLKGISRIGDNLIETIIKNRPYHSLEHFLEVMNSSGRTVISKDRVAMLIKAGAFDELEGKDRKEILYDYIKSIADQKKNINLNNMLMLSRYGLVPGHLDYQERLYHFTRYIRRSRTKNGYRLDEIAQSYYFENGFDMNQIDVYVKNGQQVMELNGAYWDSIYAEEMEKVKKWMSNNKQDLLTKLNHILLQEEIEKYAQGEQPEWELESLGFYHGRHRLEGVAETIPVPISKITDIGDRERDGNFYIKDKVIPKYNIRHIIGTVIDSDKAKRTVTLSTPEGVVEMRVFQSLYTHYDKVNFINNEYGEKEIIQDSFFTKGTFLLVSGFKDGDTFFPKTYKAHGIDPILMFKIDENNHFIKAYEKL